MDAETKAWMKESEKMWKNLTKDYIKIDKVPTYAKGKDFKKCLRKFKKNQEVTLLIDEKAYKVEYRNGEYRYGSDIHNGHGGRWSSVNADDAKTGLWRAFNELSFGISKGR